MAQSLVAHRTLRPSVGLVKRKTYKAIKKIRAMGGAFAASQEHDASSSNRLVAHYPSESQRRPYLVATLAGTGAFLQAKIPCALSEAHF